MSEPAPILRVTVDTPVYGQDGEKLGKVKEVRGNAFKIETGLFQKDYWLPGNCIAEAAPDVAEPDGAVTLIVPVVVPAGTVATSVVVEADVTVAVVPLNFTVF